MDDPGIVYGNTGLWMILGLSKAILDYDDPGIV